jgi:phage terminase large subunit GpA-like protein
MSFLSSREWKKIDISTPTTKGASKIEERYFAADQRRWHVPCPHCRKPDGSPSEFVFEFGANFRFEDTFPHRSHYVAPCCGTIIEAHEKNALVRAGRWIATATRAGAFPSYHFDTFSSPFVPWDEIAKARISAGDDPGKRKTFYNLWLGLPYEIKGDAPDHVRILERREDGFERGHVPPKGLMLVGAADVQMRGIWFEIVAIAPVARAGLSMRDILTAEQKIARVFPDAFDGVRRLDAFAIDSGYRSHVVYAWVRSNQLRHELTGRDVILATKGLDGWAKPPIGTPSLVDNDLAGHKVKKGCQLWPVGTWPLKGAFYDDLRKIGLKAGADTDPAADLGVPRIRSLLRPPAQGLENSVVGA